MNRKQSKRSTLPIPVVEVGDSVVKTSVEPCVDIASVGPSVETEWVGGCVDAAASVGACAGDESNAIK
jgi:hypothetical protein